MPGKLIVSYWDNTEETGTFKVPVATMTAANFDAQVTAQDALIAAIAGVANGAMYKKERVAVIVEATPALPTVGNQREIKFLARYHDAVTGDKYRAEIPVADLTAMVDGKEYVDLSAGNGDTLKTAWEAVVVAERTGNAVVLDSVTFVTKNT